MDDPSPMIFWPDGTWRDSEGNVVDLPPDPADCATRAAWNAQRADELERRLDEVEGQDHKFKSGALWGGALLAFFVLTVNPNPMSTLVFFGLFLGLPVYISWRRQRTRIAGQRRVVQELRNTEDTGSIVSAAEPVLTASAPPPGPTRPPAVPE